MGGGEPTSQKVLHCVFFLAGGLQKSMEVGRDKHAWTYILATASTKRSLIRPYARYRKGISSLSLFWRTGKTRARRTPNTR